MRIVLSLALLAGLSSVGLARAAAQTQTHRLAFEDSGADTTSCLGLRLQFQDFRGDMHGGIGFVVRLTNTANQNVNWDATKLRAELASGRRVPFLSAYDIASQFMQTEAARQLDNERKMQERRDIESDQRFINSPVRPWVPTIKFLAFGWGRVTGEEPSAYLPVTVVCDREPLGRINFTQTGGQ